MFLGVIRFFCQCVIFVILCTVLFLMALFLFAGAA